MAQETVPAVPGGRAKVRKAKESAKRREHGTDDYARGIKSGTNGAPAPASTTRPQLRPTTGDAQKATRNDYFGDPDARLESELDFSAEGDDDVSREEAAESTSGVARNGPHVDLVAAPSVGPSQGEVAKEAPRKTCPTRVRS